YVFLLPVFFFSSRRRHTRSLRDWSSDVCSSDLAPRSLSHASSIDRRSSGARGSAERHERLRIRRRQIERLLDSVEERVSNALVRSEERRVGKESRLWWAG